MSSCHVTDGPSQAVANGSFDGPYQMLSQYLPFPSLDQHEWWEHTAPMFEKLLAASEYSLHQQYQYLTLYGLHVIPALGPFPHPSRPGMYMHPLGAIGPLEFSQKFNKTSTTLRLSLGATSYKVSTGPDPCNRFATGPVLHRFKEIGIPLDLQLYHQLLPLVTITDQEEKDARARNLLDSFPFRGQNYLGMDLNGSQVGMKLYLTPAFKSVVTGIPPMDIAFNAVRSLDCPHIASLPMIEKFVSTSTDTLSFVTFSCDLVDPARTRYKFYFTERGVSLERVCQIWTLNDQLSDSDTISSISLLHELWNSFGICGGLRQPLPMSRIDTNAPPSTLPIILNLEIHPNNAPPLVRIYLPVGGIEDNVIADGLDKFFTKHGFSSPARLHKEHLPTYVKGVEPFDSTYLQLWIAFACSPKKGPEITVYYH